MGKKGGDVEDAAKKRINKGHRQRGAGTVAISKGEVTREGVVCKEWQRTPVQLIREYCQSKKKPNPRFHNVKSATPSQFRIRCVLPDGKNEAKDLSFCTESSFDNNDEAKHYSALLALFYLDPTKPHERKLPDFYRDAWLQLVAKANNDKNKQNSQTSSSMSTSGKGTKGDQRSKPTLGNKKYSSAEINSSTLKKEEVLDQVPIHQMNLWENHASELDKDEEHMEKSVKKAILVTSDNKFASYSEYQQAVMAKKVEKNKKLRDRENRIRANPNAEVFMSAKSRKLVEDILEEFRRNTSKDPEAIPMETYDSMVVAKLTSLGFTTSQAECGLRSCSTMNSSSLTCEDVISNALDWLCLNIPEWQLPKGFNPQGTQLDVIMNDSHFKDPGVMNTVLEKLMNYGFLRVDGLAAMKNHQDIQEEEPLFESSVRELYSRLLKKKSQVDGSQEILSCVEDITALRNDEIMALEAIYQDQFKVQQQSTGSCLFSIDLGSVKGIAGNTILDILIPHGSMYPMECPLVFIRNPSISPPSLILSVLVELHQECMKKLGSPLIYELCNWIDLFLLEKLSPSPVCSLYERQREKIPMPIETQQSSNVDNMKKKTAPVQRQETQDLEELSLKILEQFKNKANSPKYQTLFQLRQNLPSFKARSQILDLLQEHQIVIINGQTGCGKTTQIPQFILDDCILKAKGGFCNIICTQPRRIAAIGVAQRVAEERDEKIGDYIGYQIRMETKRSRHTRLMFCTTGILLRSLLNDRNLSQVSHIIVDEVHERNVDTDFLLTILKDLLPRRPDLRLVLMSATMDTTLFSNYFGKSPVINIPGFTYPVQCSYLDEILEYTRYVPPKSMRRKGLIPNESSLDESDETSLTMASIDEEKLNYGLAKLLIECLLTDHTYGDSESAILIFLPGALEIKHMCDCLLQSEKLLVLPLHGGLSAQEQSRVFSRPPKGIRKVVVSTNIAETSVTIDDIVVVIDFGKVKETQYDATTRMSSLVESWVSRASADQRKGRAGRVQKGFNFRMYSRTTEKIKMPLQQTPEIHRVSLENVCLQIKKLNLGDVTTFLLKSIEPPMLNAIEMSLSCLRDIQALGKDDSLTPLGHHLATLPIEARLGKFLIYGSILRCIDPVLTIASVMSCRSPFLGSVDKREMVLQIKKNLSIAKSDHLMFVNVYNGWKQAPNRKKYCFDCCLSYEGMQNIEKLRQEYSKSLQSIGFLDTTTTDDQSNLNGSIPRIVKAALCAGLYSNVIRVQYPQQKFYDSAQGALEGKNKPQELKYFVQSQKDDSGRVFMHPASVNFGESKYECPWLVYTNIIKTSKPFVCDSSMVSPYALLLFGGDLHVDHENSKIVIDQWIHLSAVARIGVLIKSIRHCLDELLSQKIQDPTLEISKSKIIDAICHLMVTDGL